MPDSKKGLVNEWFEDHQITIHIAEYEKLREEILQALNVQQQTLVLTLGSASVAIPLLVGQTTTMSTSIVAVVLYVLAIIYAVLAMNFVTQLFIVSALGKYIHEYLVPRLNKLTNADPETPVLQWEVFLRRERAKTIPLLLGIVGPIGSVLLVLLPSLASLLAAQYTLLIPAIQAPQQTAALQFVSSWLIPLSVLAWAVFVLSFISILLITAYNAFSGRWAVWK